MCLKLYSGFESWYWFSSHINFDPKHSKPLATESQSQNVILTSPAMPGGIQSKYDQPNLATCYHEMLVIVIKAIN